MNKLIFAILATVGLSACLEPVEQTILVSSVTVSPDVLHLRVGQISGETPGIPALTATIAPSNATDRAIVWSSSDPTTVSVDQNGRARALRLSSGQVTITAAAGGKIGNCFVSVDRTPVTRVSLDRTAAPSPFIVGQTFELGASFEPADATDKKVNWASRVDGTSLNGDEFIRLTPSADGSKVTVEALKYSGSNTITIVATSNSDPTGTYNHPELRNVMVTPTHVGEISLTGAAPATFEVGQTFDITATVSPSDATNKTIVWSASPAGFVKLTPSSDGSKVTVEALKYSGSNTITITATSASTPTVSKSLTDVKVTPTAAASINLAGTVPAIFQRGDSFDITATVVGVGGREATDKTVKWTLTPGGEEFVSLTPSSDGTKVNVKALKDSGPTSAVIRATSSSTPAVYKDFDALKVAADVLIIDAEGVDAGKNVSGTTIEFAKGVKHRFSAKIAPDITPDTITWSSNRTGMATVGPDPYAPADYARCLVTATGSGTADITVSVVPTGSTNPTADTISATFLVDIP